MSRAPRGAAGPEAVARARERANARQEQVVHLYGLGIPQTRIARRLGVSTETIRRDLIALGIDRQAGR